MSKMGRFKTSLKVLSFISSNYFVWFFIMFLIMLTIQIGTFALELNSNGGNMIRLEEIMDAVNFPLMFLILYVGAIALLAVTLFKFVTGSKSITTLYFAPAMKNTVFWSYATTIVCTIGLLWGFQVLSLFICGSIYTNYYASDHISMNGIYIMAAIRWNYLHLFFPMNISDLMRTLFVFVLPINVAFWTFSVICANRIKTYKFIIIFIVGYLQILNGILGYESDTNIILLIIKALFGIFYTVFPAMQSYLIFKYKEIN